MSNIPKPRKGSQPGLGRHGSSYHKAQKRDAGGGGGRNDKSCCFAGQAVKAVWAGKFRLARRFARLDVKTRLGLI